MGRMTNRGAGWLRRSLTLAILLGLLLVPATCTHAAGPHSIFIDPRPEANATAHHDHHHASKPIESAASIALDHDSSVSRTNGQPSLRDLPSTMLVSIVSNNVVIDLPQLLAIPSGDAPETQRVTDRLTGVETPVEVPPPRQR